MPAQARELIVTPLLKVIMPLDGGTRPHVVGGIDVSGRTGSIVAGDLVARPSPPTCFLTTAALS